MEKTEKTAIEVMMEKLFQTSILKIGAHQFTFKYPHTFNEKTSNAGMCDHMSTTIFVSGSAMNGSPMPSTVSAKVFFHELLHAIDHIYCMGAIESLEAGEEIISGLAEGLVQVINDNNII